MKKNCKLSTILLLIFSISLSVLSFSSVSFAEIESDFDLSKGDNPSKWKWNSSYYFEDTKTIERRNSKYTYNFDSNNFDKIMEYQDAGYEIYYRVKFEAREIHNSNLLVSLGLDGYFESKWTFLDINDNDDSWHTLYHYENDTSGKSNAGYYESSEEEGTRIKERSDLQLRLNCIGNNLDEYEVRKAKLEFAIVDVVPPEVKSVKYFDDWQDGNPISDYSEELSYSGDRDYIDMLVKFDEPIDFNDDKKKYLRTNLSLNDTINGSFKYHDKKDNDTIVFRYTVEYGDYARTERRIKEDGTEKDDELSLELRGKTDFLEDLLEFGIVDKFGNDFTNEKEKTHKYKDVKDYNVTLDGDPPEITDVEYSVERKSDKHEDGPFLNVNDEVIIKVKLSNLRLNEKAQVNSNGYIPLNNGGEANIFERKSQGYSKDDWIIYKYKVDNDESKNIVDLNHTINANPNTQDYFDQVLSLAKKMGIQDDFGNYARMQSTGDEKLETLNFPDISVGDDKSKLIVDSIKPLVEFNYNPSKEIDSAQIITMTPNEKGSMLDGGEFYYVINKNPNHPTEGSMDENLIGRITYPYSRDEKGYYSNIDNLKDIEIDDDLYFGVASYDIYDEKYNPVSNETSYDITEYILGSETDVVFDGRREISGDFYIHTYMRDRSGNESWQTSEKICLDNSHMNIVMNPMGTSKYVGDIKVSFELLREEHSGFDNWQYRWISPLANKDIDSEDIYINGSDTYEILRDSKSDWKVGEGLDSYGKANIPIPEFDVREHGDYYLLVRAYDKADNGSYIVSEPFKFDKIAPNMLIESMSGGFTIPLQNHSLKVLVDDEHSVLGDYKYYFSKSNMTRKIDDPIWKTLPLDFPELPEDYNPFDNKEYGDLTKKEAILKTEDWSEENLNGYAFLHVYARDISGNEVIKTQDILIDNGGFPSIAFNYDNTIDNQYKEVIGHIMVSDDGGVEELYYKWSESEDTPEEYISMDLSDKDKSNLTIDTPLISEKGRWYLHVKAVDIYGNTSTELSDAYLITSAPTLDQFSIDIESIAITNKRELPVTITKVINDDKEYNYVIYDDENCLNEIKRGQISSNKQIISIDLEDIESDKQVFYIKIEDNVDLASEKAFKIEAIYDITAPSARLLYSPAKDEGVTDNTVTVQLADISDNVTENVVFSFENHVFTANGEFDFILRDEAGNERLITAIVNWISEDRPSTKVNSDQLIGEAYNNIVFNISAEKPTSMGYINISNPMLYYAVTESKDDEVSTWIKYENSDEINFLGEDGSYYVQTKLIYRSKVFQDVFGPYILDKESPKLSTETYTFLDSNGVSKVLGRDDFELISDISSEVTVDMTFDEDTKIKSITNAKNKKLKNKLPIVFTKNDTVRVVFADDAGNESSKDIVISNMKEDTDMFELFEITPDITTNASVTVNIAAGDGLVFKNVVKDGNPVNVFVSSEAVTFNGDAQEYYKSVKFDVEENASISVEAFTATSSDSITYTISSAGLFTRKIDNIDKTAPSGVIAISNVDKFTKKTSIEIIDANLVEITKVEFIKKDSSVVDLLLNPYSEGLKYNKSTNELLYKLDGKIKYYLVDSAKNTAVVEKDLSAVDTSLDMNLVSAKYHIGENEYTNKDDFDPVNEDITVVLEMPEGYSVVNNSGAKTKIFAAAIEYDFLISNGENIEVYHIDLRDKINKSSLSVNLDYKINGQPYKDQLINGKTNKDVVLTITGDNLSKVIFNDSEIISAPFSYTFKENEIVKIKAIDSLGNEEEFRSAVDFIDKTPVRAGLFSLYTSPTNAEKIKLQFLANKQVDIISINKNGVNYTSVIDGNNVTKYECYVDDNGSYSINYRDVLGNENTVEYEVKNFDRKAPVLKLLYNESAEQKLTKKDVYVKVALVDEDSEVDGIKVLNTVAGEMGYLFKENGSFTFRVADTAGNISEITAEVDNIDRKAPSVEISYSETSLTNKDVTATVVVAEDGFKILNKDIVMGKNDSVSISDNNIEVTFTDNGFYKLDICDEAENKTTVLLRVLNIDRLSPTIKFEESYIVTHKGQMPKLDDYYAFDTHSGDITSSVTISNLDISTEGKKTVEYSVSDEAGNETSIDRDVLVIGDDFTIVVDGEVDPLAFVSENETIDLKIYNFLESSFVKYGIGKDGTLKDSEFKQNNTIFIQVNDRSMDGKSAIASVEFYGKKYGWHTVYIQDVNRRTKKFTVYITKAR